MYSLRQTRKKSRWFLGRKMALWILFTSLAPFRPVLTLCYSNCQALRASLGRLKCVWETREKDLFAIHVNDLHLALKGRNVPELSSKVTRMIVNSAWKQSSKKERCKNMRSFVWNGLDSASPKDFSLKIFTQHRKIQSSFCSWKATEQSREDKLKGKLWMRDQGTITFLM